MKNMHTCKHKNFKITCTGSIKCIDCGYRFKRKSFITYILDKYLKQGKDSPTF